MPNTGVSMRRIWLSLARDQGEETADGEQYIVVLAGGGHRSDQDLEQLVELGSRRDGDRDGSGDLGAHFVGEIVVGDADGVGLSGLTGGGVVDRVSQGAGDSAVVVAGSEDRLAHDQVAGQFHPDDDVGAAGSAAVVHDEGRWNTATATRSAARTRCARGGPAPPTASRSAAAASPVGMCQSGPPSASRAA